MIADFIKFILSNFTLTLFILGILSALLSLINKPKPLTYKIILEAFISYFILFNIGISYVYNFFCHVFFAETAAAFIGWANSPFQYEIGYASLGFGIVGIIAFRSGLGFRAATVIAPTFFSWGAAVGHVYQMVKAHNFAPGNAGIIFWTDILIPLIGLYLIYQQYKLEKQKL